MARRRRSEPFSLFAFQDIITAITGIVLMVLLLLTLELLQRRPDIPVIDLHDAAAKLQTAIAEADASVDRLSQEIAADAETVKRAAGMPRGRIDSEIELLESENAQLLKRSQRLDQEIARHESALKIAKARLEKREEDRRRVAELQAQSAEIQEQVDELRRNNRVIYNLQPDSQKTAWLVETRADVIQLAEFGRSAPPVRFAAANRVAVVGALLRWAASHDPARNYFVLLVRSDGIETFQLLYSSLRDRGFAVGIDPIGDDVMVIDPETGAGR